MGRTERDENRMSICWMKTADVYPDGRYGPDFFMAFDPAVRFPRFHMETGDETIGNVHLIQGGLQSGKWEWSVTVALPGPAYGAPTNGVEETRSAAARRSSRCIDTTCRRGRSSIRAFGKDGTKRNPVRAFGRAEPVDYKNGVR